MVHLNHVNNYFQLFQALNIQRLLKPLTMDILMDIKEIKKLNKLVTKHRLAYTLGLETDVENTYPPRSEKFLAFEHGRYVKANRVDRRRKTV